MEDDDGGGMEEENMKVGGRWAAMRGLGARWREHARRVSAPTEEEEGGVTMVAWRGLGHGEEQGSGAGCARRKEDGNYDEL